MTKKYSQVGYIARIQPPHKGHIETIKRGLEVADEVLVMIGSAYSSRNIKNPFTYEERAEMLRACFTESDNERIVIMPLADSIYNMEEWVKRVQRYMDINMSRIADKPKALIGFKKDHTSFYLDYFPQYDFVEMENIDGLHSTDIREIIFGLDTKYAKLIAADENMSLPAGVKSFLKQFFDTDTYMALRKEWEWNENHLKLWSNSPYVVTFNTGDSVVVCAGHILLVKRRALPGKGLWALPGGYVNAKDETIAQCALRELQEETRIDVPPAVLKSYYTSKNMGLFDSPTRSTRGRIITHAFKVNLPPQKIPNGYGLPKVKGSDDAEKAKWIPLNEFQNMETQMFEDHFHIASYFLGQGDGK